MPLTILNVAFPFAPVGPEVVGGAEQIVSQLDRALVQAGYLSLVVAQQGSQIFGTLIQGENFEFSSTSKESHRIYAAHQRAIEHALRCWPVDLVHMHGLDFCKYLPETDLPILVTLHLPPGFYPDFIFKNRRRNIFLHCVSESQARACSPDVELLGVIPNGVSVTSFAGHFKKGNYAVSLGRICPEKGFHFAINAAKRAGIPLALAGQVFPYESHETYFRDEILPRLDEQRRFIGPIGFRKKRRLISGARCVVIPSLVAETSSLVAMEALACGTPVVAFPNGALPEIVEHCKTGFLVEDETEMAEAVCAASSINPETCRSAARERFSIDVMLRKYLAVYEQLAAGRGPCARETGELSCVGSIPSNSLG